MCVRGGGGEGGGGVVVAECALSLIGRACDERCLGARVFADSTSIGYVARHSV